MTDKEVLELLLSAYVRMVELNSCEPGEKSHMLAYHTEFIKRQINIMLKRRAALAKVKSLLSD
jgi:hypothetical protein